METNLDVQRMTYRQSVTTSFLFLASFTQDQIAREKMKLIIGNMLDTFGKRQGKLVKIPSTPVLLRPLFLIHDAYCSSWHTYTFCIQ